MSNMNHVINYQPIAQRQRKHESSQLTSVEKQLRYVGVCESDIKKAETYSLARNMGSDELILAAVYGKVNDEGASLIVFTAARIIYLNEMPLLSNEDEVGYGTVTDFDYEIGRRHTVITLNAGIKTFTVRAINSISANNFIRIMRQYASIPDFNIVLPMVETV